MKPDCWVCDKCRVNFKTKVRHKRLCSKQEYEDAGGLDYIGSGDPGLYLINCIGTLTPMYSRESLDELINTHEELLEAAKEVNICLQHFDKTKSESILEIRTKLWEAIKKASLTAGEDKE